MDDQPDVEVCPNCGIAAFSVATGCPRCGFGKAKTRVGVLIGGVLLFTCVGLPFGAFGSCFLLAGASSIGGSNPGGNVITVMTGLFLLAIAALAVWGAIRLLVSARRQ